MAVIIALLVVGALLILLETVLPGLIAGIIGVGCVGAAVVMAYVRFDAATGNLILAVAIGGLIVGAILYVTYFPNSKVAQVFVSKRAIGQIGNENPSLLHQTGQALTTLRPSGTAVINGQRVDVVSEGAFIEAGAPVKVIALEGLRVVVRADS
jgi:membrane-bound serine protease (ClpP class)